MEPVTVVVAAAIIAGLVQILKVTGMPDRWAGLVAVGLGTAGGLVGAVEGGWLPGLIAGLTAVGAYSASKNTAQKVRGS